ncbi:MAG: hypothetical protein Q7R43_04905 [Candidatus Daviesbacteria bacterium]|nr:hypothetical protein [Candidatus Daviesbacteria bacterium]
MNFYKIIIFIIVLFIFISILWKSNVLNISQVEIENNNSQCLNKEKFSSEFNIKNENIFFIDKQKLEEKILLKYICVKNISLEKIFPSKIKIIINGRFGIAKVSNIKNEPVLDLKDLEATSSSEAALINWSVPELNETEKFIADDEGIIFANDSENNLPIVYLPDQILKIGEKIKVTDFNKIALVFIKLPQLNISFTQTKLNEYDLEVLSQPKIVVSLEKNILRQLASLQLILEKAKIDNRTMEIIDLRFDKPVVKYLLKK